MKCATAQQMRELDRRTIEDLGIPGMVLMEVAGRGVANLCCDLIEKNNTGGSLLVVAGPGNNGGDGYVAARHLRNWGYSCRVVLLGQPEKLRGDAAENRRLFLALGGEELVDDGQVDPHSWWADVDVLIDAIFGTGLTRSVTGRRRQVIEAINRSALPVVAVDIASGLDADLGTVCGVAVKAQCTATFACLKRGMVGYPGAELCGDTTVVDIGIPSAYVEEMELNCELFDLALAQQCAPTVQSSDHKGRRGHLMLVAGSTAKAGAAWLAARGGLRCGAGLLTIVTSPGARSRMGAYLPEVMVEAFSRGKDDLARPDLASIREHLVGKDAAVVGPGLAHGNDTRRALEEMLLQLQIPAVVDAEGLNLMAGRLEALQQAQAPLVLTPHPGEMARLLDCSTQEVQANRFAAASDCAQLSGQVVLLKGARTVIADAAGQLAVIPISCPTLGTAGSGDVLCGVIGALLARGLSGFTAAAVGAFVHGSAGTVAAERQGGCAALASDIADAAGVVLDELVPDDEVWEQ